MTMQAPLDLPLLCRRCGRNYHARPGALCPADEAVLIRTEVHRRHPDDRLLGCRLDGKYRIFDVLGQGAFGSVYRALQDPFGRTVALKVIRSEAESKYDVEELRVQFVEEARAISRLNHDNIVTLYDFSHHNDHFYMVLEFVEGRTVRHTLQSGGPLEPDRAARWICQVLSGLDEAHSANVLHLDLKPENLMVAQQRNGQTRLKILDFGITQMLGAFGVAPPPRKLHSQQQPSTNTQRSHVMGTPKYMAPEQGAGRSLGPETDIYAVGIILYEMLEGRAPFNARNTYRLMEQHSEWPVPAFTREVPESLAGVVYRALAKDPRERYASASEMLHAIRAAMGTGEAWSVTPDPIMSLSLPGGNVSMVDDEVPLEVDPALHEHLSTQEPSTPPLQSTGLPPLLLDIPVDEGRLFMQERESEEDPGGFFATPSPRKSAPSRGSRPSAHHDSAPSQRFTPPPSRGVGSQLQSSTAGRRAALTPSRNPSNVTRPPGQPTWMLRVIALMVVVAGLVVWRQVLGPTLDEGADGAAEASPEEPQEAPLLSGPGARAEAMAEPSGSPTVPPVVGTILEGDD